MPTLELKHSLIGYIQNIHGVGHEPDSWTKWLPEIGCPVDRSNSEEIEIEVFPDRPDLLSHETIARASRSFESSGGTKVELDVVPGDIEMVVDSTLENVRPVIMGAVVKGVDTGSNEEEKDEFIQSLMDHQEKLHLTLGRRRRFSSIGVHDLSSLQPPFRVTTVPGDFSFVPLACDEEMSINEILTELPKGVEYSALMDGMELFPVILDSSDRVLSFPPIINGSHTTVDVGTQDFFIDVTGWDERSCEACLLLICLSLAERGGVVESIVVSGFDGNRIAMPIGVPRTHRVPDRLIRKILGMEVGHESLRIAIEKMGGEIVESRTVTDGPNNPERWADCVVGELEHIVSMPRWRSDIMHPIDIVEDIAIGIGFENLPEKSSEVQIDASPLKSSNLKRRFGESMRACGLQEVQSLTLSNERDQFELVRWMHEENYNTISNPITSEHTILRQYILPSLLRLLSANRHHELPQRVYELGEVVRGSRNKNRGSWACAEVGAGFTSAKGIALAMLRDMGAEIDEVEFKVTEEGSGPWIHGRGCQILVRGEKLGEFGEIDPRVSHSFGLKAPIHAGEIDLDKIGVLIRDPIN